MMKSVASKMKEGRCQGRGRYYVPFYKAGEMSSIGTASSIMDPIVGRNVSVLSTTERDFWYIMRWNDGVEEIREQYLLDPDRINEARMKMGLRPVSGTRYPYTTDFLIDYTDGSQKAFSIKWKGDAFNPDSARYQFDKSKYNILIRRQRIEQEYWESQNVSFRIITLEDIAPYRAYAENIALVLGYYRPRFIRTPEQKMMYLAAHKAVRVPMMEEKLNPKELADEAGFDIDEAYDMLVKEEEFYEKEEA